ncbi:hypothetical protein GCM10023081_36390 [Arthrobacter ginkgonis]|uniref:HpaB/PvcC/4-BUDH N-terminal domain-containing protein n=1 Tax=Arthrobacter ginkgonis TaxID=1630594 RepID=A0ABP7CT56_9MICC
MPPLLHSAPTAGHTSVGLGAAEGRTYAWFRAPKSSADLIKGRDAIAEWAKMSYGWMGRSPDCKASFLASMCPGPTASIPCSA